jgi:UDP-glucose 4-epimerase
MENVIVTGCAGFIGSHMVDDLISKGIMVVGIDNLKTGNLKNLDLAMKKSNFKFIEGDLLDENFCKTNLKNCEVVYHFAANADVRYGTQHPRRDFEQNTMVTINVLESMRVNDINKIIFSSTGSIYGEAKLFPTREFSEIPIQTSLYGASKMSCENFIQAYVESFDFQAWIFRFVSIIGPRYSHGHIIDFVDKLREDSSVLNVLGNGLQKKSYLHVFDCIRGIQNAISKSSRSVNIFNLGSKENITVRDSISYIVKELGVNPTINFGESDKGWIGDNPIIDLDISLMQEFGWNPRFSIKEGIIGTVQDILNRQ